ncbi:hypothetical protein [Okeania sp. SIO2C9]|uniref:hypothetical protein n=1 Tax=Okeania sp. SIO2C9 TaxID=2607791 RepID=UPI0025DDF7A9|nr:hypothetical protein [Okeania sp. SIO2C9]
MVHQRFEEISFKSRSSFDRCIDKLGKDGYLKDEKLLIGNCLFSFQVDDDWNGVFHRQESRNFLGRQILEINVLDLVPHKERPPDYEPRFNLKTSDLALKVLPPLTLFFNRPDVQIFVGVGAIVVLASCLAIIFNYQGKINLKMEAKDKAVTGEVTVDGRKLKEANDEK